MTGGYWDISGDFHWLLTVSEQARQYAVPGHVVVSPYVMGVAEVLDKTRYADWRRRKREVRKFTKRFFAAPSPITSME